jgi:hypothetical protein
MFAFLLPLEERKNRIHDRAVDKSNREISSEEWRATVEP